MRHGPHRKWRLQQFLVVVGFSNVRGIHRYTRLTILLLLRVPQKRFCRTPCLATIGRIDMQKDGLVGGIYEARRCDIGWGAMLMTGSAIQKLVVPGIHRHTTWRSHKPTFTYLFRNKGRSLKQNAFTSYLEIVKREGMRQGCYALCSFSYLYTLSRESYMVILPFIFVHKALIIVLCPAVVRNEWK
jgi:hypothetical protein